MLKPPSTAMHCPVMNDETDIERYAASDATSSGCPTLFIGVLLITSS